MKRRTFLATLILAATGVTIAALAGRRLLRRWRYRKLTTEEIATRIHEHFPYLSLDAPGVLQFASDYQGERGELFGDLRSNVFTNYLLSTDFFPNGADESRIVAYVGLYNPYHGCENPFAEL